MKSANAYSMKSMINICIKEYFNQIIIPPEYQTYNLNVLKELNIANQWNSKWSTKNGIYVFFYKMGIYYIGRTIKGTTFGKRIAQHINKQWFINNKNNMSLLLCIITKIENDYWIPSLEIYLLDKLNYCIKNNIKRG